MRTEQEKDQLREAFIQTLQAARDSRTKPIILESLHIGFSSFSGIDLSDCVFSNCIFEEPCFFIGVDLSTTQLSGSRFQQGIFLDEKIFVSHKTALSLGNYETEKFVFIDTHHLDINDSTIDYTKIKTAITLSLDAVISAYQHYQHQSGLPDPFESVDFSDPKSKVAIAWQVIHGFFFNMNAELAINPIFLSTMRYVCVRQIFQKKLAEQTPSFTTAELGELIEGEIYDYHGITIYEGGSYLKFGGHHLEKVRFTNSIFDGVVYFVNTFFSPETSIIHSTFTQGVEIKLFGENRTHFNNAVFEKVACSKVKFNFEFGENKIISMSSQDFITQFIDELSKLLSVSGTTHTDEASVLLAQLKLEVEFEKAILPLLVKVQSATDPLIQKAAEIVYLRKYVNSRGDREETFSTHEIALLESKGLSLASINSRFLMRTIQVLESESRFTIERSENRARLRLLPKSDNFDLFKLKENLCVELKSDIDSGGAEILSLLISLAITLHPGLSEDKNKLIQLTLYYLNHVKRTSDVLVSAYQGGSSIGKPTISALFKVAFAYNPQAPENAQVERMMNVIRSKEGEMGPPQRENTGEFTCDL